MSPNTTQPALPWQSTSPNDGPRFAEFFAGIGLVRMGLEAAGWRIAYANDIDADKRAMYDAHFGDADRHFDLGDIHGVRGDSIPDVEVATASFPCTDLSLAGGRLGFRGKQSSAFWGFVDVLKGMGSRRPPLVLLENVTGFLTSHGGADFRSAVDALNSLGYGVDAFVLDAKWFVPQSRPRLFVVGDALSHGMQHRVSIPSRLRPTQLSAFINANPDIRWSLADLPEPPPKANTTLREIIEPVPDDSDWWWTRDRADYLYNQFSDRHKSVADEMIAKRRWSYGTVFRRVRQQADGTKRSMGELRTDGIAGCLRTPKGGSGRQILFKAGYGRFSARLLTPRECARLMGADDFIIGVPSNQAFFGFGDAVCVPAIEWVARNRLNPWLDAATAECGQRSRLRA